MADVVGTRSQPRRDGRIRVQSIADLFDTAVKNPSIDTNSHELSALRRSHSNPDFLGEAYSTRSRFSPPARTHTWVVDHHAHNLIRAVPKARPRSFLPRSIKRDPITSDDSTDPENGSTTEKEGEPPKIMEISFAEMQRMRLRKLQCKLIEHAADMSLGYNTSIPEPKDWEKDLQDYTQALRDYEYMSAAISNHSEDPFIASSEDPIVKGVLQMIYSERTSIDWDDERTTVPESVWRKICISSPSASRARAMPSLTTDEGLLVASIGGTRRSNARKSKLRSLKGRLATAALAAVFLIVPMWLMVLKRTKWTALISSTAFVLVFGCLMAVSLERPMDVLSATAAYAAVLVVFVGAVSFGV